jgi:hypothetical protein
MRRTLVSHLTFYSWPTVTLARRYLAPLIRLTEGPRAQHRSRQVRTAIAEAKMLAVSVTVCSFVICEHAKPKDYIFVLRPDPI